MIEIEHIFRDERERKILHEVMERLGLSAVGTVRYFCRMGQFVDSQIQQGYKLAWIKDDKVVDPLSIPKAGPAPPSEPTGRSCNRHYDCDRAEEKVLTRNPGKTHADISPSFHCHDDECEDCFGK